MGLFDKLFGGKEKKRRDEVQQDEKQQTGRLKTASANQVCSPSKGTVIPLAEVEDEGFASGMMGPGVGIEPEDGCVYAPVAGEVIAVFPTGHAAGIRTAGGLEVLIHIGIDTVNMKGDGFEVKVREGDHVSAGDMMVQFDLDKVKAAGYKPTILLLVPNAGEAGEMTEPVTGPVEVSQPLFALKQR